MAVLNTDLMKLDVAALGERAWRWWTDELRGLWDNSFLRRFGQEPDLPVIILGGDGALHEPAAFPDRRVAEWLARIPGIAQLLGRAALARPVTLQLGASHYLHTQIDLPAVNSRVLPNLLKFEIERHTPLALTDTCFGYRIVGRDRLTGRMTVDLFVAKLRTVNRAAEAVQDSGHRVARLTVLAADGTAIDMPVFGAQLPAIHIDHHGRLSAILATAAVLLIAACGWSYSMREDRLDAALQDQLTMVQEKAARIEILSRRQVALERDLRGLEKRKTEMAMTPVLEAVAKELPDDSWLSGLEINGNAVMVSGFSNAAFRLPAIFDASGRFTNARLLGPVQHDSGDPADRFDMAVDYVPARHTGSPP